MNNNIHIVIAGGTFFKIYDPQTESMVMCNEHDVDDFMLELTSLISNISYSIWGLKDSLHMTHDDRESLYDHCKNKSNDKLVVIHGTGTMIQTAKCFYNNNLANKDNMRVVFTGSWTPYCLKLQEVIFNLGFALGSLKNLKEESFVKLAMNGMIFSNFDLLEKNIPLKTFQRLER